MEISKSNRYSAKFDLETATANNRKCHSCGKDEFSEAFLTDLNNYRKKLELNKKCDI